MRKLVKPKYAFGEFLGKNSGALTMGADMLSQMGGVGKVLGGAGKGVISGASLGVPGMIAGGALGLIGSIIGGGAEKRALEEAERKKQIEQENANRVFSENTTMQAMAGFNTSGNTEEFYAKGGTIDLEDHEYEVEKDEVVQGNANLEHGTKLASDMQLVGGKKHEQGGTGGSGGERVFSDRLKLGKEATEALAKLGIKLPNNATFAEAATSLGRNKGKAEKKIASRIAPSVKTGKRMIQEQEDALETIFNLQEIMKPRTDVVKKFAFGGIPDNEKGVLAPIKNQIKLAAPVKEAAISNVFDGAIAGTSAPTEKFNIGNWLGENQGQIMNALNYAGNKQSINKLDTTVRRSYIPAPRYNYNNRSSIAKSENSRAYRTAIQGLTSSSQGVNASNAGAMYANMLNNNSQINNQENIRKDAYDENYNSNATRVNFANTSIRNEANDESRELENNKRVVLPLQARNAFLQGYAGNTAMTQRTNLDKQRMLISAYLNDENGVLSRANNNFAKFKESAIYKTIANGGI